MQMSLFFILILLILVSFSLEAVSNLFETHPHVSQNAVAGHQAVVFLRSENNSIYGRLIFNQEYRDFAPTHIVGNITGIPRGKHGIGISEWGDLSQMCGNIGWHFNPDEMSHGAPTDRLRHVGDLGNIEGESPLKVHIVDGKLSLFGRNNVLGRTLVIYEAPDDFGRSPNRRARFDGNVGGPIACGIIGKLVDDYF